MLSVLWAVYKQAVKLDAEQERRVGSWRSELLTRMQPLIKQAEEVPPKVRPKYRCVCCIAVDGLRVAACRA